VIKCCLLKQKFYQVQLEPNLLYNQFAVHNSYIRVHLKHVSRDQKSTDLCSSYVGNPPFFLGRPL
jgi:hypothetical protein